MEHRFSSYNQKELNYIFGSSTMSRKILLKRPEAKSTILPMRTHYAFIVLLICANHTALNDIYKCRIIIN